MSVSNRGTGGLAEIGAAPHSVEEDGVLSARVNEHLKRMGTS
jgi:hypothetical protein